jgi:FixJ family two-component response regulator
MNPWKLSAREETVLTTLSKVGTAKLAAKEIGISFRTVEIYLRRARDKMQTQSTLIAVLMWDRYVFARMCKPETAE